MESEDEEQRSSQLNDEDLENLEREAEQKGTAAATKWSMKKLEAWLTKRKVNVNLTTGGKEELAALLHRFYGELKSEKTAKPLSPSTLVGIRSGIQRGLLSLRSDPVHIVNDPIFAKANSLFKAKCRLYAKHGNPSAKHKVAISDGDLKKISEYFSDERTLHEPRRLQQAVWFIIAYNLGCRGREIFRQLQDSIAVRSDDSGLQFLEIQQAVVEKNHPGGPNAADQTSARARVYHSNFGCSSVLEIVSIYLGNSIQHVPGYSSSAWPSPIQMVPTGIRTSLSASTRSGR